MVSGSCQEGNLNILALQYPDSGKLSTDVPDVDTGIDWLVYLARYSQQCQAQSHFVVRSRLDIVENTEIMVGPNQSFYCGTLRPDCRPFRTGIFKTEATPSQGIKTQQYGSGELPHRHQKRESLYGDFPARSASFPPAPKTAITLIIMMC